MKTPIVSKGPDKWDVRFIELARHIATWSKDPSSKVGTVIVDPDRRIISTGYNGFPMGVSDNPRRYDNRDLKYRLIVHAEPNAILQARTDLTGCVLYSWPFPTCERCAGLIIQAGIVRVVSPPCPDARADRWAHSIIVARGMYQEAGVEVVEIK